MRHHLKFDSIAAALAVSAGALMACWPALLNRYPLIYFGDSIFYFRDGMVVAKAFLHRDVSIYAERSEIYSLGILLWHWNRSAWPVVVLQAVLCSYTVWLVTRSIAPRRAVTRFLVLMVVLSALTSMSWYASTLMPDILGGPLYLCMYLLLFARETLSTLERWCAAIILVWSAASHSSHLVVAVGLCVFFATTLFAGWRLMAHRGRALAEIAALIGLVMISLYGLRGYLYGRPSLNGNHPPFLMARIVADGPGLWYLQTHCGSLDWYVCRSVKNPPQTSDEFLWDPLNPWVSASKAERERLLDEERPLVLGALRAYPWAELGRARENVVKQLQSYYEIVFFTPTDSGWLYQFVAGARIGYPRSLQMRQALPVSLFSQIHHWVVVLSGVVLIALAPVVWRRQQGERLIGLAVLIGAAILANAIATAVLSGPNTRYEGRIIWLVPMLAGLALVDSWGEVRRLRSRKAARQVRSR